MKHPVIAIGLDAADPRIIEKWMSEGHLKNLNQIRQGGAYGRLYNQVQYGDRQAEFSSTEPLWVMFSTGCLPAKTGFWDTVKYDPKTYGVRCDPIYGGYDYKEFQPFYALGENYKVAAFDVPVSGLSEQLNGIQVLGWGGHFPFVPSVSNPPEVLPEIVDKYGKNPVLRKDNGKWWSNKYFKWVQQAVKESLATRAEIIRDLLKRDQWDLFVTGFGETHTLGHDLYDRSQPDHMFYPQRSQDGNLPDPLLAGYQQVDEAVGKILAEAPEDAYVVCFAVHGMQANMTDQLSMLFIPEVLYRFNFPGKVAIAPGEYGTPAPPPITRPLKKSWVWEVWRSVYEPNPIKKFLATWMPRKLQKQGKNGLLCPFPLQSQRVELSWMPAFWYKELWPQMRAFALPAFADGHIRINLKGREPQGIVDPSEYDALCDELTQVMMRLQDGRTGKPLVKEVIRTRQSPLDDNPKLPDPDLVVVWHEIPTDVVDSPDVGRIGPVTLNRPGGHRADGFVMVKGPGVEAGSSVDGGRAVDLGPTILSLMNAPVPDYMDGKPLLQVTPERSTVGV